MKSNKLTNLLVYIFFFCFTLSICACKQLPKEITPSVEYASYVKAYTGGVISRNATVRVELAKEQPLVALNSEIKNNPFSFTPSLNGKAYWIDNNTIEFIPEEGGLIPGQLYNATFKLGDFVETDEQRKRFEFSFRVQESNFSVNVQPILVKTLHPDCVTIQGEIRFSDVMGKKETVEKIITAKLSGKTLPVDVEATPDGLFYTFSIVDVPRTDDDTKVLLTINGASIGIDETVTREVVVPANHRFEVLSTQRVSSGEAALEIVFTEPIDVTQDLKGLIVLQGASNQTIQVTDNKVTLHYEEGNINNLKLTIHAGIRSVTEKKILEDTSVSFSRGFEKPAVEILTNGSILPDSKNLIIPFRAVSLHAVDLTIVRIFENNVLTFLQTNTLSGSNELRRSGRLIYKKMLLLDSDPTKDITRWEDYSIDLSGIIKHEPGAIYRIMLSFKQSYSAYPCDGSYEAGAKFSAGISNLTDETAELDDTAWDIPQAYYSMDYGDYDWEQYNWRERDDPCRPTYYMMAERKSSCNVLSSNIGVIVKRNSMGKLWIAINDILNTQPLPNVDVKAYNFQLQRIGEATTDSQGFAEMEPKGVPFVIVASHNGQKTYLRVVDGEEKSTSRFDVGGKEIKKGLKGFIYGERGVWRPGDTLHVSFVLEDPNKRIPVKHPVTLELYNPRGQFYTKQISTDGINGFYAFHIPTYTDDPTGLWNLYIKVGGAAFHKALRIETIKPNRLKINLKLPNNNLIIATNGDVRATLSSNWLTGATASNLKTKVEMSLSRVTTQFKNYSQYVFNNPATNFEFSKKEIFNGTLNAVGDASFTIEMPQSVNAPGMLQGNFTSRVFEPGGDASINTLTIPFAPFTAFVGINLNQPSNKYIDTDTDHVFDVVTVDAEGKPVNRSNLEYKIYRIGWNWWWEHNNESFDSYINNNSITPEATGKLSTVNGKAQFSFRVDYPQWGRYLVYVKDRESGHATGGTIFIDWPEWRGRSTKSDPTGITMLTFSLDKASYEVGEMVTAIIPAAADGNALVSLENGSTVLSREWIKLSAQEDTKYQFVVTETMSPNVYLHVMLLQPHTQTVNNLPIRMYGVLPVLVNNKQTVLEPILKMPDVLRPEKEFSISVYEKSGKPMTYTIAIVDDGLLDLTNFKTPNPWNEFYAREALGVRTWDMYDEVIGAYSGSYGKLFSVGGDQELKQEDLKANRFRPVVKYLGPFIAAKGRTNTHKVTLPMYVGSVRTMVIAGEGGAYGSTEKTTPVRSPLMILSSLPRVLSINEEVLLPINVFAMEDAVKEVTIDVETSSNLQLAAGNKNKVIFATPGDKMCYFTLKTGKVIGKEVIKIKASGNGHTTEEKIEIDVRNPNPVVYQTANHLLAAGEHTELNYQLETASEDNWVKLEVSRIPSVDISCRLDYLYNYNHYCTEQIVSKAFPLLFLNMFKDLDNQEQENLNKGVREAIKHLYGRQLPNGEFVYWPGYAQADEWITSYAGMFLSLAKEKGYDVNLAVLNKWKAYQRSSTQNWMPIRQEENWLMWQADLQQAFRLYTLALSGAADMGGMNRMKEIANLSQQAKWRLAAAYAMVGKNDAANELIFNAKAEIDAYSSNNAVYGSSDRDEAMILETLVLLKREKEAFTLAQRIAERLSHESYYSTQSTAFSLFAMAKLAGMTSGTIDFDWELNGIKQTSIKTSKAVHQQLLPITALKGSVILKNNGNGSAYACLLTRMRLIEDNLPAISNNLRLKVIYTDLNGLPLSIDKLKQGTDFLASVTVTNVNPATDYRDIALTHIIPTGWEIYNERMTESEANKARFDYQDIRDDRVLTYFSLLRGESKTFKVRIQASYAGIFTLPAVQCEAMYDVTANARTQAGHVQVIQ
ncbi:alpha-2-macroglobulin [Bacteroides sp. 214]|uniref:alpha-2-macroglobulin family protein n=1 Tax=Bacteroides sp. 214 TaxID=2302935 RepID=UPI0013D23632|nr:MG2 domain-containing protein [Bacteroides sp. 214]NDW11291.1 alpha-2-macroglobulin [Bacteroides sp. 214]